MNNPHDIRQATQAKERIDREDAEFSYLGSKAVGPLLNPDDLRSLTPSPAHGRPLSPTHLRGLSPAPTQQRRRGWWETVRQSVLSFWARNRGLILVATSQLFGSSMNVMARLLELEGEGMHPFQILFARMSITAIASCTYMYWKQVPHFPLGAPEVRWLLLARGFFGFFGIYGMWYSIMYLPLAEATVISFLAPSLAGYICHVILKEPFTRREQIASFIALAGVVLIARPTALFSGWGGDHGVEPADTAPPTEVAANFTQTIPQMGEEPTDAERLGAIGFSLLGVMGASGAYTTIRWIGKRAHPLISVNYFSTWCTLLSSTVLLSAPALNVGQPALHFALPSTFRQAALLLGLGCCGFVAQFMLTSGLTVDKNNRATAMVYTQMLFAAGFDKWIFGYEMGPVSVVGCGLIVSSLLWVALSKKEDPIKAIGADIEMGAPNGFEDVPMLGLVDRNADRDRGHFDVGYEEDENEEWDGQHGRDRIQAN